MQTRRIGSLDVSVIGLGCNNFGRRLDEAGTGAVVHAALDAGINFLDTADIYGGTLSEQYLGRVLEGRRDEVVLATKFGMAVDEERQGAHPDYVRRAVEDSLRRLRTDRIDLYQLHKPDPEVPIADTLGALDDLVREGKVREIGCSNFSAAQLREARDAVRPGGARFVCVQNEYSLLHRAPETGVLAECRRSGIAFIPYFPLASGLLTGKYRRGHAPPAGSRLAATTQGSAFDDETMRTVEALRAFAERRGHTLLELAISWLLARDPVATVIAGATKPEQVRANAAAAGWRLSADELAAVDGMTRERVA
ncbi:MAG TPA: aldo/keto reductase [Gemmatimonadaceae bacterium]|jgi:aryl-alcohol dehydrogenase-like predicted oxidoreductase|nr:aldo/keto reductase [Gemmatimonadaceae bacterium]